MRGIEGRWRRLGLPRTGLRGRRLRSLLGLAALLRAPDAIGLRGDRPHVAPGAGAQRLLPDDRVVAAGRRVLVVLFDPQPVVALVALAAALHAPHRPGALQLGAVQREVEVALGVSSGRVADRLPPAAVP